VSHLFCLVGHVAELLDVVVQRILRFVHLLEHVAHATTTTTTTSAATARRSTSIETEGLPCKLFRFGLFFHPLRLRLLPPLLFLDPLRFLDVTAHPATH
jgi:hypothetical protein